MAAKNNVTGLFKKETGLKRLEKRQKARISVSFYSFFSANIVE